LQTRYKHATSTLQAHCKPSANPLQARCKSVKAQKPNYKPVPVATKPMPTVNDLNHLLQQENTPTPEALSLFDQLEPVGIDFMLGRWQGSGFPTSHAMDGLLEATNWYGKEFVSANCVHPLLFKDVRGEIFKLSPNPQMMKLALRLPLPKNDTAKQIYTLFNPLLKTDKSQAQLRMMEHRGKISATMIYDHLPIHDIFRKVNENTLLGLIDYKESPQPFFFILKRA